MEREPKTGKITIAPDVLETVVRLTTLAVPGVTRLTPAPGVQRMLGQKGVEIEVTDQKVNATVHVVVEPGLSLLEVGRTIQREVARALKEIVGMDVEAVNVSVEDITKLTKEPKDT